MPPLPSERSPRLLRRFLGVVGLLAALIPATLGVQVLLERHLNANSEAIGQQYVDAAHVIVQERLTQLLHTMEEEGRSLAAEPVIRQMLSDPSTRTPTLVRPVLEAVTGSTSLFRHAPLDAIELYRADGELFAWSGFAAPLDRQTVRFGIADTLRTAIALDGPSRRTLTLWQPVLRGEEVLGAVRIMRRAQVSVPVRNKFLQDFNIADEWRNEGLPPFSVSFSQSPSGVAGSVPLFGLDGTRLGWVVAEVPNKDYLENRLLTLTHGIAVFWMVLLAAWFMAGFWFWLDGKMWEAADAEAGYSWTRAGLLMVGWSVALWAVRYGLHVLEAPARWLENWEPAFSLFDNSLLHSDIGAGLLQSAGELIVTTLFAVLFALVLLRFALVRTADVIRRGGGGGLRGVLGAAILAGLGLVAITAFEMATRHGVLDSTLGYFEHAGPIPDLITAVVIIAFLACAYAAITIAASCVLLARAFLGWGRLTGNWNWRAGLLPLGVVLAVASLATLPGGTPAWLIISLCAVVSVAVAWFLLGHKDRWAWPLTFRGMLFSVLVLVPLTYLVMSGADRERENDFIEKAAEEFTRGLDPRAVYAIEQVLAEARSRDLRRELAGVVLDVGAADSSFVDNLSADPSLMEADESSLIASRQQVADSLRSTLQLGLERAQSRDSAQAALDEFIARLVTGSLLASMADYTVDLAVLNANGDSLAVYSDATVSVATPVRSAPVAKDDPLAFDSLRSRYESDTQPGFLVVRAPVGSQRGTYRYAGIGPVQASPEALAGWLFVRATPRLSRPMGETPYPSVLVPAGLQDTDAEAMSFSEYDNGVLVRSRGAAAGPFQLDVGVRNAFAGNRTQFWRTEVVEDLPYRAYYQRIPAGEKPEDFDAIAVRLPASSPLDHLFNLVRMTIAGLMLGLIVFVAGLLVRRRSTLLSARRSHFRDKVLSRFLIVGIATVAVTGIIGRLVIVTQNEQGVEELLRTRLQRVEAAVTAEAGPGTPVAAALDRARADVASEQLGIDLHVYRGYELVSTSRPQLVRQRLIDERLPADVYRALYADGRRYAFTDAKIGSFRYTIGYKAIADEMGRVIGAVAVPTLPEQASIEAGQARMVAYLFAVLLVLMLGIFVTTALLAEQLTRPFKSLREGLKAVGEGETYEPIPVETRDEVGQLVETFNEMQSQLKESREQLARQERELAWREMARQVAHEIKNPLTPMKLSVQHLRRSYQEPGENASPEDRKFGRSLDRITTTLIEQIDTLSRIAGEFSSFARLPQRKPEVLDLNEIIQEASALFDDEAPVGLAVEWSLALDDQPLFVEADREELRRAYINLFANALQAIPEGREKRISVRTSQAEGFAQSDVQDNGTGIPEAVRERIFQPNFSTKTSGTGLGLAIVRKAIEAGGGSISFETKDGEGTVFHIRLPLISGRDDGKV